MLNTSFMGSISDIGSTISEAFNIDNFDIINHLNEVFNDVFIPFKITYSILNDPVIKKHLTDNIVKLLNNIKNRKNIEDINTKLVKLLRKNIYVKKSQHKLKQLHEREWYDNMEKSEISDHSKYRLTYTMHIVKELNRFYRDLILGNNDYGERPGPANAKFLRPDAKKNLAATFSLPTRVDIDLHNTYDSNGQLKNGQIGSPPPDDFRTVSQDRDLTLNQRRLVRTSRESQYSDRNVQWKMEEEPFRKV